MNAGDSKVLLPSGAARGALRFQWEECSWASPTHRCVSHRMSMNWSRTVGLAWTLLRFTVLPLEWLVRLAVHKECWCGRSHAQALGGGRCAPEEHVPSAHASWDVRRTAAVWLVANSDQQTGIWRLARPAHRRARRMPRRMPDQLTTIAMK